jgi:hypothetical protein
MLGWKGTDADALGRLAPAIGPLDHQAAQALRGGRRWSEAADAQLELLGLGRTRRGRIQWGLGLEQRETLAAKHAQRLECEAVPFIERVTRQHPARAVGATRDQGEEVGRAK